MDDFTGLSLRENEGGRLSFEAPVSLHLSLSRSIHKFDNVFVHSGLSAALGHESFDPELMTEGLGPNGVSHTNDSYPIIRDSNCESKHLGRTPIFNCSMAEAGSEMALPCHLLG